MQINTNMLYEKTSPTKLFLRVALPGILSMLVSSLYQIIDGIFVGQLLGAEAFAALNLVMPLVIINFAIADLIGVGSSVPIAIKLGQKDEQGASNLFSAACLLIIGAGVLLGGILFVLAKPLVQLMSADATLVNLSSQYLQVYALMSPITTIIFAVDNFLRICGKVKYSLFVNIFMAVSSAVLEYLFLAVFKFGIWGAGLATCIGMMASAILAFIPFFKGKLQLKFSLPKLSKSVWRSIIGNGAPNFLNNVSGQFTSIIMNVFLIRLGGANAVSAYGVLMFVDGFVIAMLYGLCDSLQPAVGYNFGAKNYGRIDALEKRCFGTCGALSILLMAGVIIGRVPITHLFINAADAYVVTLTANALVLFAFTFLTRWFSLAVQGYLSAVGQAGYATVMSVSMAFVFPVLYLFLLKEQLGLNGLWLNMPISSLSVGILAAIFFLHYRKKQNHIISGEMS